MAESESPFGQLVRIYYRPSGCRERDGRIIIDGSGYFDSGSHATLDLSVGPNDATYDFWLWFIARLPSLDVELITDEVVEKYRAEFDAAKLASGGEDFGREDLMAHVAVCPRQSFNQWLMNSQCAFGCLIVPILAVMGLFGAIFNLFRWALRIPTKPEE